MTQPYRAIRRKLLEWFTLNGRCFPWREKGLTTYEYIIAEVLLQRTNANSVAKHFRHFVEKYPSFESIAIADASSLVDDLKPIGLANQKSSRLIAMSKQILTLKSVPSDRREIEKIPLFGYYIASAIELIVFKKRVPLIDVNMARVMSRIFGIKLKADIRYDNKLFTEALKLVNCKECLQLNWCILDYAALICKARNPQCNKCVVSNCCAYFKEHR